MKLTTKQQTERINRILNHSVTEECGCCEFKFVAMYTFEGYGLCPDCDEDLIETAKEKLEAA